MALPTRENLRKSELVFRAKIAQVATSTMLELPASDTTTVVRVTEVYQSPELLRFLRGKSITVVTRDTGSLRKAQEVFVSRRCGSMERALRSSSSQGKLVAWTTLKLRRRISSEAETAKDDALERASASPTRRLVVAGKVIGTRAVQVLDPATMSEHTPMWRAAIIQVINVEQGSLQSNQVEVLYPQSRDVMWYKTPKFHAGQEGVWILRSQRIDDINREGFTALNPLDFHSTQGLEHIRRLIRRR